MDSDAPVGMIGLGLMGLALSIRLIEARIPLLGFDIDSTRCEMLKAHGGVVANSVRDLASRCRAIIIADQTLKDAELILEEARRHGLHLPITATQADLLRTAIVLQGPDSDSAAVIEAIRRPTISKVAP